jgi:hypothetical protein
MKEYMFMVQWPKDLARGYNGGYGVLFAKSMSGLFWAIDSQADPSGVRLKQINQSGEASFYLDLTDLDSYNTNNYNSDPCWSDWFPKDSKEYKILKAEEEGEKEEQDFFEGGQENGWYSFDEFDDKYPEYPKDWDHSCWVTFTPFEDMEDNWNDLDLDYTKKPTNVFQMVLCLCEEHKETIEYECGDDEETEEDEFGGPPLIDLKPEEAEKELNKLPDLKAEDF